MTVKSYLGPFYRWTDHSLDGYGGTWMRRYTVGVRVWAHSFSLTFAASRHREKGR